jgi:uncharacterized membrane protein YqiK
MDESSIIATAIWTGAVVAILLVLRLGNVFRYIPNNQVGIVEKMWAAKGSIKSGFIALHGEAGFEPEILRGGVHVFFPFTYRIHRSDLVTVGQGKIAYVFARDGAPHSGGLIPTAMLSSMFGRMMPDALEKLKEEAPKSTHRGNSPMA